MGSLTTTAERIIRQPALTMPGNATGSEASCTSLTASQIRTLLSLGTTSDVTFDIVRATTSVQTPLVNNASAALTLGNSTYGVTVPGAATFSGDISMSKTSAQGYIRAYGAGGINNVAMYHDNSYGYVVASGRLLLTGGYTVMAPTTGITFCYTNGLNSELWVYGVSGAKYTNITHNDTDGILSTSSGKLKLSPATTLQVTTAATFDSYIDAASYRCDGGEIINTSGALLELGVGGQSNSVRLGVNSGASGLKVFLGNTGASASMLHVAQNGTTVMFRVADNSADAPISCAALTTSGQLTNATGAITASTPAIFTQTWNSGAVTFTGLSANFTDTSSASGSMLLSIKKSTSDRITITKHGLTTLTFDTGQIFTGLTVKGTNGTSYWNLGNVFESGDSYVQLRTADAFAGANHGAINLGAGYIHIIGGPTNRTIKTYNGLKLEIAALGGSGILEVTGGITASGSVLQTAEVTNTPSGTTQTITLTSGNYQTLTLASSTGDVTVTLTVPATSGGGEILIVQHGTTPRDITWAASAGSIIWLGTEPTWNADATSAYRKVEWRFNGTNTFLTASGSS